MKKLRPILLWSLCLLLLSGCGKEPVVPTVPTENQTLPAESLATTRLTAEPWDSGRLAHSAQFRSGETETGFYFAHVRTLYYCDKSDMTRYVPVCPNPDCEHENSRNKCCATVDAAFVLRDNRIYHLAPRRDGSMSQVPIFKTPVTSMALDGSDGRLEYVIGGLPSEEYSGSGSKKLILTDRWCLECASYLNEAGSFDTTLTLVDETGETVLFQEATEDSQFSLSLLRGGRMLFGDPAFTCSLLDPELVWLIEDQKLVSRDLAGLPMDGGYLSGDSFWCFRPGEGYYAVNLTTGEEIKLAESRMEQSAAAIVLPNCILESDLLGDESGALRTDGAARHLWFFDGQQWQEVSLPEELQSLEETAYLDVLGVASDRILLLLKQGSGVERTVTVCQILLETDSPALEMQGTLPTGF